MKITPMALKAIDKNIIKNSLIAALEGPGSGHKEYMHVWPRDAIFTAIELMNFDRKRAESIIKRVMDLPTENGLFYQRYEFDGSPDPKAWCNGDGNKQLDQDALRFVAAYMFPSSASKERLKESYLSLIKEVKEKKPSVDVWEQKKGYFFYTTASLIWGLSCAEKILEVGEDHKKIVKELIESLDSFFDRKLKSFVKSPSERIVDLEVVLGINVLFESGLGVLSNRRMLERVLSTLSAVERELCFNINGCKVPIRYRGDFWDGERVNSKGRPWPMGSAMICQAYSHVVEAALQIGEGKIAVEALKGANRWFDYLRKIPCVEHFPEQIEFDGSLPRLVPRPLAWCAAEFIKTERIYSRIKERIRGYWNDFALCSIYRPKFILSCS